MQHKKVQQGQSDESAMSPDTSQTTQAIQKPTHNFATLYNSINILKAPLQYEQTSIGLCLVACIPRAIRLAVIAENSTIKKNKVHVKINNFGAGNEQCNAHRHTLRVHTLRFASATDQMTSKAKHTKQATQTHNKQFVNLI